MYCSGESVNVMVGKMSQQHYSLTWDSYKSSICSGFSLLQQNAEFVDMTLAADGHIVKVHQMLMALASPYLKDLITSVASPHPVIFLNNVTHSTLCGILQFIYTGEVVMPQSEIETFIATAKALHIKGLDNLSNLTPNNTPTASACEQTVYGGGEIEKKPDCVLKQKLPVRARKAVVLHNTGLGGIKCIIEQHQKNVSSQEHNYNSEYEHDDFGNDHVSSDSTNRTRQKTDNLNASQSNLQYTLSNRGSVQVILNRYLYGLTNTSASTSQRTWKCVDNRLNKCRAYIITKGNMVLKRANPHSHPFHDKKILHKIKRKSVFTAIEQAEANNKISEGTKISTDGEMGDLT